MDETQISDSRRSKGPRSEGPRVQRSEGPWGPDGSGRIICKSWSKPWVTGTSVPFS